MIQGNDSNVGLGGFVEGDRCAAVGGDFGVATRFIAVFLTLPRRKPERDRDRLRGGDVGGVKPGDD